MNCASPRAGKDIAASGGINISGDFFLSMVLGINVIVADHFKMLVRDMYHQAFDKINDGDTFGDCFMILMALIMESHGVPVIVINSGSSNDRSAKVSANVFNGDIRRTQVRFGSDIKAFGMFFVDLIFKLLKRRSQFKGELIQKDFTESQTKEVIIKMGIGSPGGKVASAPFRNQGMDVRIPFQIPAKGMEDADKARSKEFGLVKFKEHAQDDIPDRMEQAVKERVVLKEKDTEFRRDCKGTVSVITRNKFTGHTKSTFLIIHVPTGRTEPAFTGKGDKFKVPTMRTAKESTAIRRIMAMDHPVDVIQNICAGAEDILDVFKVVRKNSLQDVLIIHKNILQ